jgi:hypothetical protein
MVNLVAPAPPVVWHAAQLFSRMGTTSAPNSTVAAVAVGVGVGVGVGVAVAVRVGVGVGVAVGVAVGVGVGVGSGVGVEAGRSVTLGNPTFEVGEGLGVGLGEREGDAVGALEVTGAGGFRLGRGAGVRPRVVGSITGSDSVAWGRLKDGTLGPEGVAVQAATASRPTVMARGMRLRMADTFLTTMDRYDRWVAFALI